MIGLLRRVTAALLRFLILIQLASERKPQLQLSATFECGATIRGDFTAMQLLDNQKITLKINPEDAAGQSAKVDGKPTWVSNDGSIATVTPSDDGLSAVVVAQALGTTTIVVSADADLGQG